MQWYQIMTRGAREDWAGALAVVEPAINAAPEHSFTLGLAAWAYAKGGLKERAENIRNQLEHRARAGYLPPLSLATAHAPFATGDTFFALIDRGLEECDPGLRYQRIIFPLHRFRSDPRYSAMLDKLGLSG